ncbi:MAG: hypothetical protein LBH94_00710 [Deltaproteobacteria bacterium]|jgi:hypothetical protein|nr:hypothetical protein [Deltaproteobacteria bacterium]
MITIDGRQSEMEIGNFANLEEILVGVMKKEDMTSRVVTDVLVNDEAFSEIYPHQAEDIGSEFIKSVEVRSMPVGEMAANIAREMYKVAQMMSYGARHVARLFRQADDAEALDMLQDLLDVTRDFMNMIGVLRNEFCLDSGLKEFNESTEQLSNLLTEMSEVLESADWILLADLLEYEFLPLSQNWKQVIQGIRENLRQPDND